MSARTVILVLSCLIICRAGDVRAADAAPLAGHASFESLNPESEAVLIDSIVNDTLLDFPVAPTATPADGSLLRFWKGLHPDMQASIPEIRIDFAKSADAEGEDSEAAAFRATVKFQDDQVTVVSDKPRDKKYTGGLRLTLSRERSWRVLLEGEGDSALAIIAARQTGSRHRGLALCPLRSAAKGSRGGYQPAQYDVSNVEFTVSGFTQEELQSGMGIGMARANVLTSPDITRSNPRFDEVYAHDPSVSLEYEKDPEEQTAQQPREDGQGSGIRVQLELQNAAGYKRTSVLQETAWLKTVRLDMPVSLKFERGEVTAKVGNCLLLLKRKTYDESFTKEKVNVPEDPDLIGN